MRMTRALLPKLIESGDGHVITIGSIAGIEPYPGGAGYNAAKHAVRAVMDVLRMELLGQPVRVSEIDPGHGRDRVLDRALRRRRGSARRRSTRASTPLTADDIADCIAWVGDPRPSHVDIDQIVVRPRDQARARRWSTATA